LFWKGGLRCGEGKPVSERERGRWEREERGRESSEAKMKRRMADEGGEKRKKGPHPKKPSTQQKLTS
jgi:hypothetical protein